MILKRISKISYHSLMLELLKMQIGRMPPCLCSGKALELMALYLDEKLACLIGTYAYLGHHPVNDVNKPLFESIFTFESRFNVCAPHEKTIKTLEEFIEEGLIKITMEGEE